MCPKCINSTLVQESEKSFQICLTALTEEDDLYNKVPKDIKDIDEKVSGSDHLRYSQGLDP